METSMLKWREENDFVFVLRRAQRQNLTVSLGFSGLFTPFFPKSLEEGWEEQTGLSWVSSLKSKQERKVLVVACQAKLWDKQSLIFQATLFQRKCWKKKKHVYISYSLGLEKTRISHSIFNSQTVSLSSWVWKAAATNKKLIRINNKAPVLSTENKQPVQQK